MAPARGVRNPEPFPGEDGCLVIGASATSGECAVTAGSLAAFGERETASMSLDAGLEEVSRRMSLRGTEGGGLKSSGRVGRVGWRVLRARGLAVPSSAAMALTLRRLGWMGARTVSGSWRRWTACFGGSLSA